MYRGRWAWFVGGVLFAIGLAWYGWSLYGDLSLGSKLRISGLSREQRIVLENIDFERAVSGDLWHVTIGRADRRGSTLDLLSVDARVEFPDGRGWAAFAPAGRLDEKSEHLELEEVRGAFQGGIEELTLSASRLDLFIEDKKWTFPEGVVVSGDRVKIRGTEAEVLSNGTVLITKGAFAKWKENRR